jgi:hypothetical protein
LEPSISSILVLGRTIEQSMLFYSLNPTFHQYMSHRADE